MCSFCVLLWCWCFFFCRLCGLFFVGFCVSFISVVVFSCLLRSFCIVVLIVVVGGCLVVFLFSAFLRGVLFGSVLVCFLVAAIIVGVGLGFFGFWFRCGMVVFFGCVSLVFFEFVFFWWCLPGGFCEQKRAI